MTEAAEVTEESLRAAFVAGFEHGADSAMPNPYEAPETGHEAFTHLRRAFKAGFEEGESAAANGTLAEVTRHGARAIAIEEEFQAWLEEGETETPEETTTTGTTVALEVFKDYQGCWQMSIGVADAKGNGHGHRLYGPSFIGRSTLIFRRMLDARLRKEIRDYLDLADAAESAQAEV
jgi:hypothetical protein